MAKAYWITGLSGAGKTTICKMLVEHLRKQGQPVVMLDGDDLRDVMGRTEVHHREERLQLAMSYSRFGKLIADQGISVAIATISMFHEVHAWNRANLPGYVEIFLDVSLDELSRRDPKGIYKRAQKGEATNVAGMDCKVDTPRNPDIHLIWEEGITEDIMFHKILVASTFDEEFT